MNFHPPADSVKFHLVSSGNSLTSEALCHYKSHHRLRRLYISDFVGNVLQLVNGSSIIEKFAQCERTLQSVLEGFGEQVC